MEQFRVVSLFFKFSLLILALLVPVSIAQLSSTETRTLFQVQKLLEYPEVLQEWTNWTSFCWLPYSPSLRIVCLNNRVTELTIVGNKSSATHSGKFSVSQQSLSAKFDIDALFTALTKLSNLKVLSLASLGLWGPLPSKINRFWSLEVLNISSNFIYGKIPQEITTLKNLTSLVMANNLLSGSVPDLKNLVLLEELNLKSNQLGPKFPSMSNKVVSIILGNNSLRSEVPPGLKNFNQLKQLDISSNKVFGPIPSFLFSLPSIEYLDLAENKLSGAIALDISCRAKLNFVDISHNLLIGKLPPCIGSKKSNRTVLSSWNCLSSGTSSNQHPYSFCHKEALAVNPPAKSKEKDQSSTKLGLILGIVGGVVGIVVVVGLLVLVIRRRSSKTIRRAEESKYERSIADKMSVRSSPILVIDSRRVPQTMRSAAIGLPPYRVFTLEEINEATNNFDPTNLMGEGAQGQLYKGWIRDGSKVLVKCFKLKQRHLSQNLMQHMEVLSKLRHRHLVSVLGHCIVSYQDHPNTASTVFVVLEHISNGSLRDYLTDWKKKEMLKWPQRMAIIIGAARGIQFLHTGVAPGIFGNNLKIENILLDETLTSKLNGYNIPMPSKRGSESPLNGQDVSDHFGSVEAAEKDDVYQLGVILLQVITGKLIKAGSELETFKLELENCLAETPSKLRGVTDPSVRGTYAFDSLRNTVEITMNCLCNDTSKRPSIEDVLWNLQYSIQVQEGWSSSGNLNTQV